MIKSVFKSYFEKISKISWEDGKMTVETLVSRYKEISNVKITTKQKYKYFRYEITY